MKCKKCGNELRNNDKFCTKCGSPVNINIENNNLKASVSIEKQSKLKKCIKNHKVVSIVLFIVLIIIVIILCKNIIHKIKVSNEVDNYVKWVESQDYSKYKTLDIKILDSLNDVKNEKPFQVLQAYITYYQYWVDECNSRILYLSEVKNKIGIDNSLYKEIEDKIECVQLLKEYMEFYLKTYISLKQDWIVHAKYEITDQELNNRRAKLDEEVNNTSNKYNAMLKEKNYYYYSTYELMQKPINITEESNNSMNDISAENEENTIETEEDITNNEEDITLNEDYIGRWTDETEGGNEVIINEIDGDEIQFDFGTYRGHLFEDLTAIMTDSNIAEFNTNDIEDAEYWGGIYGTLEFIDNEKIILTMMLE